MSQISDLSGSSKDNYEDIEQACLDAAQENDASTTVSYDMGSTKLTTGIESSFVGKVRSNVTSMISKLFQRSPKNEIDFRKNRRGVDIQDGHTIGEDVMENSPSEGTNDFDSSSIEILTNRSRLNVPDITNAPERSNSSLVIQIPRSSTPRSLCFGYTGKSRNMFRRRQELCRKKTNAAVAGDKLYRNLPSGLLADVNRFSPPSSTSSNVSDIESAEYNMAGNQYRSEKNPQTTDSHGSEEVSRTSLMHESFQRQQGQAQIDQQDDQSQSDRESVSSIYVPFGDRQNIEVAYKIPNNQSQRYSTFLGNSVAQLRQNGSTGNVSFNSHLNRRKSLFTSGSPYERPAFNVSLYGNSSHPNYLIRKYGTLSPFYNGVTRYGGASSPLKNSETLRGRFNPVRTKPVSSALSTHSQRTLQILEECSKPFVETRRQALAELLRERDALDVIIKKHSPNLAPGKTGGPIRMRQPYTMSDKSSHNSALTNDQQVPRTQTMLGIMQALRKTTETAREMLSNQSSTYTLPPQYSENKLDGLFNKQTTKIKPKINRMRPERSASDEDVYGPNVPVVLPNIKLPELAAIPKFELNFAYPSSSKSKLSNPALLLNTPSIKPVPDVTTTSAIPTSFSFTQSKGNGADADLGIGKDKIFKFSAPEYLEKIHESCNVSSRKEFSFGKVINLESNDQTNSPSSSEATSPTSRVPATNPSFKELMASAENKWECKMCMIRNEVNISKCVACESPKPKVNVTNTTATTIKSNAPFPATLLASSACNKWECEVCMIRNEQSAMKCIACESSKPTSKATPMDSWDIKNMPVATPTATAENAPMSFQQLISSVVSKWVCEVCMIRNEQSATKCVACESPKPGAKVVASAALSTPPTFDGNRDSPISRNGPSQGGTKVSEPQKQFPSVTNDGPTGNRFIARPSTNSQAEMKFGYWESSKSGPPAGGSAKEPPLLSMSRGSCSPGSATATATPIATKNDKTMPTIGAVSNHTSLGKLASGGQGQRFLSRSNGTTGLYKVEAQTERQHSMLPIREKNSKDGDVRLANETDSSDDSVILISDESDDVESVYEGEEEYEEQEGQEEHEEEEENSEELSHTQELDENRTETQDSTPEECDETSNPSGMSSQPIRTKTIVSSKPFAFSGPLSKGSMKSSDSSLGMQSCTQTKSISKIPTTSTILSTTVDIADDLPSPESPSTVISLSSTASNSSLEATTIITKESRVSNFLTTEGALPSMGTFAKAAGPEANPVLPSSFSGAKVPSAGGSFDTTHRNATAANPTHLTINGGSSFGITSAFSAPTPTLFTVATTNGGDARINSIFGSSSHAQVSASSFVMSQPATPFIFGGNNSIGVAQQQQQVPLVTPQHTEDTTNHTRTQNVIEAVGSNPEVNEPAPRIQQQPSTVCQFGAQSVAGKKRPLGDVTDASNRSGGGNSASESKRFSFAGATEPNFNFTRSTEALIQQLWESTKRAFKMTETTRNPQIPAVNETNPQTVGMEENVRVPDNLETDYSSDLSSSDDEASSNNEVSADKGYDGSEEGNSDEEGENDTSAASYQKFNFIKETISCDSSSPVKNLTIKMSQSRFMENRSMQ